jgi:hypothetical protein
MTSLDSPPAKVGVKQVHERIKISGNRGVVRSLNGMSVDHSGQLTSE